MGVLGSEEMDGADVLALLCFHEGGGICGVSLQFGGAGGLLARWGRGGIVWMEGWRGREARVCFLGWRGSGRELGEKGGEGRGGKGVCG